MSVGGFLFFNAICDAVRNIGKDSEVPPKGTKAYKRAVIGSICAIVLWIVAIALFISDVFG